jgi:dienelactone hydrolase
MRLFWSIQPTRRLPLAEQSFSTPEALTPVELTALIGGRRVASARLLRSRRTSDLPLTKTTLPNEGFIGTFAARPSHASPPAVLIIAGSLPGHDPSLAEQLASNGFPALAIGYWGEPGLAPSLQNIPLEYYSTALHWLAKQPWVDPRRIVVLGISRGGEAALLLGVSFPELVHGAITCSGGDRNFGGVPTARPGRSAENRSRSPRSPSRRSAAPCLRSPEARMRSGQPRRMRGASPIARAHADKTNVVARIYPGAGHGAGCLLPNVPLSGTIQIGANAYAPLGGTPAATKRVPRPAGRSYCTSSRRSSASQPVRNVGATWALRAGRLTTTAAVLAPRPQGIQMPTEGSARPRILGGSSRPRRRVQPAAEQSENTMSAN